LFPAGSSGQEELLQSLTELRKKLVAAKAEQDAEKKKLIDENKKLQYQVLHLKRAVAEADARRPAAEAKLAKGL
jgi:regulator of replication initiation timing